MTLEELKVVISAETKGLEKAVKGVKNTLNGLTKTVSNTTKKITAQFNKMGKSINNSFKGLAKMAGLTALTAGLVKLGKSAIQAANDLEIVQRRSAVIFGQSSKEVDKWANNLMAKFGMAEGEAKTLATSFKGMANSMGIADKAGTAMSLRLSELSADMASFYGTTTDDIGSALNAIFTGNARALRQFNIALTDANLSAYALSQGMKKSYSAMSDAEKVALRYSYVMAQTSAIQGNAGRTANTYAGQMARLKSNWGNLLEVLGTGLKQVLTPVLNVLNNILASITTITKSLFKLLGVDFSIGAATVSAGAGVADIADGLDDATSSAKALNKEIAGFDELETIGDKSGGLADALSDASSDLDITMPEVAADDTGEPIFKSFKEALEQLQNWFENTMDPWMVDKATKFADWLNKIFGDKDTWAQLGTTIGAGLNAIIHALDAFWTNLDGYNIGSALGTFLNNLTTKVDWESVGHAWGEKLKTQMDIAIGFLETYDFTKLGESIAKMLDAVPWKDIGTRLATLLSDMLLAAMDFAIGLSTGHLGENVSNFVDGFTEGWKGEELKTKFVDEFKPAMQEAWNEIWGSLKDNDTLGTLITDIEELTKTLGDLIAALALVKVSFMLGPIIAPFLSQLAQGIPVIGNFTATLGLMQKQGFNLGTSLKTAFTAGFGALGRLVTDANTALKGFKLSEFGVSWGAVFNSVAAAAKTAITSTITFITQTVPQAIHNFGDAVVTAIAHPIQALKTLWSGLQTIGAGIKAFAAANPLALVVAAIVAVVGAVVYLWKTSETFRNWVHDFYDNTIKPVIDNIVEKVKDMWENHLKPIFGKDGSLGQAIQAVWGIIKGVWDKIAKLIGGMIMIISPVIAAIVDMVGGAISGIIDTISGLIDMLDGLLTFIAGVFTGDWEKAWEGIKKIFEGFCKGVEGLGKGLVNILIGFINGMLQGFASGFNALIRKLNGLKIPDWVPGIGGQHTNFGEFRPMQIPYLAKGGVLTSPTVAMLGEYQGAKQNPEIAAPESLIRDIIVNANGEMVSAFYQMAQQIIAAIDDVDMSVKIGDDTIAQAAKRGADKYKHRTGQALLT